MPKCFSENHYVKHVRLRNSCTVFEHKTKDAQGRGSFNITLSLFVYKQLLDDGFVITKVFDKQLRIKSSDIKE